MKQRSAPDAKHPPHPPLADGLPEDEHDEELIDEALVETFPASDPIAVKTPEPDSRASESKRRRRKQK